MNPTRLSVGNALYRVLTDLYGKHQDSTFYTPKGTLIKMTSTNSTVYLCLAKSVHGRLRRFPIELPCDLTLHRTLQGYIENSPPVAKTILVKLQQELLQDVKSKTSRKKK